MKAQIGIVVSRRSIPFPTRWALTSRIYILYLKAAAGWYHRCRHAAAFPKGKGHVAHGAPPRPLGDRPRAPSTCLVNGTPERYTERYTPDSYAA